MKNTRLVLNLAMLAVVLLLVLAVANEIQKPEEKPASLTLLQPGDAQSIRIERNNQETLHFAKTETTWRIKQPINIAANQTRIESLLKLLTTTSHSSFSSSGKDLAIFGLDSPLASITIENTRIEFGDTEPVNRRRYVKINDTIHLITDIFFHQLKIELPSFVNNKLFDASITKVSFDNTIIDKNAQGGWQTNSNNAISQDDLQVFVDTWQNLQATRIQRAAATFPKRIANVTLDDGSQVDFEITAEDTSLRRLDNNIKYKLLDTQFSKLFKLTNNE